MAGDARLFVLATLQRLGEAHGHEVTREAAVDRTETWAHVSQGALYSALRRCATDGLVTAVRVERIGAFPPRTVDALTPQGRTALAQGHSAAWALTGLPPDPFDLALSLSDGGDPAVLRTAIEARIAAYTQALAGLTAELAQLEHRLEPTARAVFEHVLLRHETEIAWHGTLLDRVDEFATLRPVTTPAGQSW